MNLAGLIPCIGAKSNTGVGTCNYKDKEIKYAILIPAGETITVANALNFKPYLEGKLVNNDASARWRAIGRFQGFTEAGREEQTEVLDSGRKEFTSDPTESTVYTLVGSSCTGRNLLDLDHQEMLFDVIYVDKDGWILCQQAPNATTGLMELGGYPLDWLSVKMPTKASSTAVTKYMIEFGHEDPKALYKNRITIDATNFRLPVMFKTLAVQNVTLTETTVSAVAGTHKFSAVAACGGNNLGVTYAAKLNATARWLLKDAAGATKTVTSFTIAGDGETTIVIPTPGTTGTKYYLYNTSVTDWATEGMKYYEVANPLVLTII